MTLAAHVPVGHRVAGVLWPCDDGAASVAWEGSFAREPVFQEVRA